MGITGSLNRRALFRVSLALGAMEKSILIPSISSWKWCVPCLIFALLLILAPIWLHWHQSGGRQFEQLQPKHFDGLFLPSKSWLGDSGSALFFFSLWRDDKILRSNDFGSDFSGFSVHHEKNGTQLYICPICRVSPPLLTYSAASQEEWLWTLRIFSSIFCPLAGYKYVYMFLLIQN